MPSHIIMLSPKLKWLVADLFLIPNENRLFFCIKLLRVWSVLDILTWNKCELEEKYITSGYTTVFNIKVIGIYKIQLLR